MATWPHFPLDRFWPHFFRKEVEGNLRFPLDITYHGCPSISPLYRLTQAAGPWGTIGYSYDPVGNRTVETSAEGVTNYAYSANRLVSSSGAKPFTFGYDTNGNALTENQRQYIYNQNQRLIKAVENGATLGEYVYNGKGQRVKKVANGKTTYYIYDQTGNFIEEADSEGKTVADYIYLGSTPIARIDDWWEGIQAPQAPTGVTVTPEDKQLTIRWNAVPEPVDGYKVYWGTEMGNYTNSVDTGNATVHTITGLNNGTPYYIPVTAYVDREKVYYYHTDHLGTPVMMTDENGNTAWEANSEPFGKTYVTGNATNNLRFPGQYYDAETALHYNYFRNYNPSVGRYVEADPIGLRGGINPFIYVGNNPVNWIDPWGLWSYATEYGTSGAGLTSNMSGIENSVDRVFNGIVHRDAVVTYTTNGTHSAISLHYSGNAIDLRTRDLTAAHAQQAITELRNALGSNYDVIFEGDHIHIEYDPPCRQ